MGLIVVPSWINSYALPTVDIVAKVKPAIVLITMYNSDKTPLSEGTGFFIDTHLVVTNSHVIRNGKYMRIQDLFGTDFDFDKLINDDPQQDLAVVQTVKENHFFLKIGDSRRLLEGQSILVIGNPESQYGTVSTGIVSALRGNYFLFTAPVSHGSSGSPVVDENGDVVGVAAAIAREGQNLNFAVCSHLIQPEDQKSFVGPKSDEDSSEQVSEEEKVANLVVNYMLATRSGKPISLSPYVTKRLYYWYGDKDVSMEQAEKENADYYRRWPYQTTHFDPKDLTIKKVNDPKYVVYNVRIPFSWSISNGKVTKQGKKTLDAYVILTTNGVGYRIVSVKNV